MKRLSKSLAVGLLTVSMALASTAEACTNFLVTKGASKDGSTFITYAADSHTLYGELYYRKAASFPKGTMFTVIDWDSGRPLGQIEQVEHTYSVVGNMNEHQLAISETTYGGRPELEGQGVIDYGSLIYITLQRAKNAREAIKVMSELIEKYGISPENEIIEIPIFFKNGTTVTYQKKGNTLGVVSKTIQPSKPVSENLRKAKENEFVIEGYVDENITDSCYNIYVADEHFLIQDEPVATVPVVNKRFTYVLKLDKMTAGRLRCIFPGGELCKNTISLYFVPGETVSLFVHNGFYNLRKSEEYDNKVNNAIDAIREETEWKTPHQPKIKGEAWKEVKHKQNYYNLLVKEVYFNDKETVLRIANKGYGEGLTISKEAYLMDEDGNKYRLLHAVKGNIGSNNEPEVRIFGGYFAFEPMPKDTERLTLHDVGIEIKNIREAKKGKVIY